METYDVAIVEAGPGGIACAIKAKEMGLEQITSDKVGRKLRKSGKAGAKLIVLKPGLQTSTEGIYAIGAAISPAYAFVGEDGTLQRKKHTDLIFTAVQDGVQAMEDIAGRYR